jgi:hypothetical protein
VSHLESRFDVKVSTLRDYVHALGGEWPLMVTFPEGTKAGIKAEVKRLQSPVSTQSER